MKKWLIVIILLGATFTCLGFGFKKYQSTSSNQGNMVTTKVKEGKMKVNATATGSIFPENEQNPNFNELELRIQMNELDISHIKEGQTVHIDVHAF